MNDDNHQTQGALAAPQMPEKAFVKFLNEWLLRCLFQEPEDTPDGIAPLSPSRIGAQPILFVWSSLTKNIAICQRLNSEYLSKVFQKHLRYIGGKSEMMHVNQNALSNDATALGYYVESGVSAGWQG
ncbi:hypothetical protein Q3G72_029438 [Acer saccharum]|nr:hypothetical protein Q3G72_029438 [Acer saccharum]